MLAQILMILAIVVVVIAIGLLLLIARTHHKVPQGRALIRTGIGGARVTYDSGMFVIPLMHKAEEADITLKTIEITRLGADAILCKNEILADIKMRVFIQINKTADDILLAAQSLGAANTFDTNVLHQTFAHKFSDALTLVAKKITFEELTTAREHFKSEFIKIAGDFLYGYGIEDCAIDFLKPSASSQA